MNGICQLVGGTTKMVEMTLTEEFTRGQAKRGEGCTMLIATAALLAHGRPRSVASLVKALPPYSVVSCWCMLSVTLVEYTG